MLISNFRAHLVSRHLEFSISGHRCVVGDKLLIVLLLLVPVSIQFLFLRIPPSFYLCSLEVPLLKHKSDSGHSVKPLIIMLAN